MARDRKEIKWYWPYTGKMHTVKIESEGEALNLDDLMKKVREIVDQKHETCESIYYLGVALTGSASGASGFLNGWLARTLKATMEEKYGEWKIKHEGTEIPKSEVQQFMAKELRKIADWIEKDDEFEREDAPLLTGGGCSGSEQFK